MPYTYAIYAFAIIIGGLGLMLTLAGLLEEHHDEHDQG